MIFTAEKLDEEAGQVAAKAKSAIAAGDTRRAAALFGDAGKIIEARVANLRKPSEKHLHRFLIRRVLRASRRKQIADGRSRDHR